MASGTTFSRCSRVRTRAQQTTCDVKLRWGRWVSPVGDSGENFFPVVLEAVIPLPPKVPNRQKRVRQLAPALGGGLSANGKPICRYSIQSKDTPVATTC